MATEKKKLSSLTEVVKVNENDYLLILQNGDSKKVQAGKLQGAKNLSDDKALSTAFYQDVFKNILENANWF